MAPIRWWPLVVFFGALFPPTSANECVFQEILVVHNQLELDAGTHGCTSINGSIYVETDFAGPLTLSDISSIFGRFYVLDGIRSRTGLDPAVNTGLTTFEIKDLQQIDTLGIYDAVALRSISLPQLTSVNDLYVEGYKMDTLDLPSLTSANWLRLYGNIST
ncbi:uncharacterized protein BP5553_01246 [Venustampulla echinocandica]|uniref:Uncharacterized protein n=1 Tax=Venustampulla echinocandica TaxID=2656787 RepID=A0A370U0G7_9HELO|nr:uncharacterized protein BP5553_01246 [Venustampulla echinocandica]RDL41267.1 hypothetical protein BP5553_01246 [Venustampulla echinocandica]